MLSNTCTTLATVSMTSHFVIILLYKPNLTFIYNIFIDDVKIELDNNISNQFFNNKNILLYQYNAIKGYIRSIHIMLYE